MAESKLLASILFLCLFFTVSLADTTTIIKEGDDVTPQSADSNVVPLTRLTFRTVNRRFPFKPIHHRHVEAIPSGENGDFENPLYYHHHGHHHDGDEGVKRMVFKRSDFDRFDGYKMFDRIRKHRHHDSDWFVNRVRKFLD